MPKWLMIWINEFGQSRRYVHGNALRHLRSHRLLSSSAAPLRLLLLLLPTPARAAQISCSSRKR
jgi:hypothetical protein